MSFEEVLTTSYLALDMSGPMVAANSSASSRVLTFDDDVMPASAVAEEGADDGLALSVAGGVAAQPTRSVAARTMGANLVNFIPSRINLSRIALKHAKSR